MNIHQDNDEVPPKNYLIASRSSGTKPNCLENTMANTLQAPAFSTATIVALGFGSTESAKKTYDETSHEAAALEDAMRIVAGVGLVEQADNGLYCLQLTSGSENLRGLIVEKNPPAIIVHVDIAFPPHYERQPHYETIVCKRDKYYLVCSRSESKIACIGNLESMSRLLSTQDGRNAIKLFLEKQYGGGATVFFGGHYKDDSSKAFSPLICIPFWCARGLSRVVWDYFGTAGEVVEWLKNQNIVARLDNKVTQQLANHGGVAIQVLDLNDDSSYDKYVVDLTWDTVAKGVGAGAVATNQEEGVGGSPKRKKGKKSCD